MCHSIMMVGHAVILTIILYLIMFYLLKQSNEMAWDRSIVIGALVLIYMIMFGHGMPTTINKNLMM